jgi:hypothetical protein
MFPAHLASFLVAVTAVFAPVPLSLTWCPSNVMVTVMVASAVPFCADTVML